MTARVVLWEPASIAGPAPSATMCSECGRPAKRLTRQQCRTCYMRLWRAGGVAREIPALDPEIAALLLPVPGTSETFAARVFFYTDFSGDCWEWTGTKDGGGYGVIGRGGRGAGNMPAHCAMWSLLIGAIPAGMQYDHLCRNHGCVNPDHGELVTPAVNKERGFSPARLHATRTTCSQGHPKDGIIRPARGSPYRYCKTCARDKANAQYVPKGPKTRCKYGHEYTPENTYTDKRGHRYCKTCKIARQREARAAWRQRPTLLGRAA